MINVQKLAYARASFLKHVQDCKNPVTLARAMRDYVALLGRVSGVPEGTNCPIFEAFYKKVRAHSKVRRMCYVQYARMCERLAFCGY